MTNSVLQRTGADRGIAFAAYGLLAASVFTAGITGVAAVILAYAARGQVSPGVKRHLNAVIGMFWVLLALWVVCIGTGLAAAIREVDDLAHGSAVYMSKLRILGATIDVSRWRLLPEVLGLVVTALATGVAGVLWSLVAPIIGVIRLATSEPKGVTGEP